MTPARSLSALVAATVLLVGACSNGSPGATAGPSTERSSAFSPDPPLPADINPIPYLLGDEVALGNVSIRVADPPVDPAEAEAAPGYRAVSVDVAVTNGALEPVAFEPDSFRVYVDTGASATPSDAGALDGTPVESGATLDATLTFDVPERAALMALLFDASGYSERYDNGLIALDPDFVPATPDP